LLKQAENEFKDFSKAEAFLSPYNKLWNLISEHTEKTNTWK